MTQQDNGYCWKQIFITALIVFVITLFAFYISNGLESPYNDRSKFTYKRNINKY